MREVLPCSSSGALTILRAVRRGDGLVAEADAEDRQPGRRSARSGRDADAGVLAVGPARARGRCRRAPSPRRRRRSARRCGDRHVGAELAEVLVQVVGELVVVVDQQQAAHVAGTSWSDPPLSWRGRGLGAPGRIRASGASARRARRRGRRCSSAAALFSVSSYSKAGSESATMPPPAWTWTTPSLTSAVRSAMAVSARRPS